MSLVDPTTRTSSPTTRETSAIRCGVILPVYNRQTLIGDAIESVVRQTRQPDRLVIVDDGSTDATVDTIHECLRRLEPTFDTKVIRQPNAGVAAARNRAARELVDCDVLAMIDSDDLWSANFLACTVDLLRDERLVAASCDAVYADQASGRQHRRDMSIYTTDTTRRIFLYGQPCTPGTIMRRRCFEQVGGFDESLKVGEDTAIFLRISLLGQWGWAAGPLLTVRRFTHGESATTHLTRTSDIHDDLRRIEDMEHFARDNHGATMRWYVWRRALATQWMQCAKQFRHQGLRGEAAWCYGRSLALTPWSARSLGGWIVNRSLRCRQDRRATQLQGAASDGPGQPRASGESRGMEHQHGR